MKIVFFANTDWYLYNFRRSLISYCVNEGFEVVLISPAGPYVSRMQDIGFRWVELPLDRRGLNPFREIKTALSLVRIIRRERPDLIHNFTLKSVAYGSLAAKLTGISSIVNSIAGFGYIFSSKDSLAKIIRPLVVILLRWALRGASVRTILQNEDDLDQCLKLNLSPPDRLILIPGSGVDVEKYRPRKVDNKDGVITILFAARLLWDKGVGEYVNAAREVMKLHSNVRFLLAGTPDAGNPGSITDATLNEWREEGLVQVLGHVEDMADLMQRVDVVVLPTAYGEGVPRILVEAAACGLPIITTDTAGGRAIVVHGVNGLLVAPRSSTAVAASICTLLTDPKLRVDMGARGREFALRTFDERIVNGRTTSVYRELL